MILQSFALAPAQFKGITTPAFLLSHGGDGRGFSHDHHASLPGPTTELDGGFGGFPSLSAVLPSVALAQQIAHERFDLGRVPQLEQVGQPARFKPVHDFFAAIAAIAAHKGGPAIS